MRAAGLRGTLVGQWISLRRDLLAETAELLRGALDRCGPICLRLRRVRITLGDVRRQFASRQGNGQPRRSLSAARPAGAEYTAQFGRPGVLGPVGNARIAQN